MRIRKLLIAMLGFALSGFSIGADAYVGQKAVTVDRTGCNAVTDAQVPGKSAYDPDVMRYHGRYWVVHIVLNEHEIPSARIR